MDETRVFTSAEHAATELAVLRKQGKKIVTTNGCFDIVHAGHIAYLQEAASLGDILVVGINADSSIRRLKGLGRPVQEENDRVLVIASLKPVYAAFIFHEDDPRQFLSLIQPAVHVKGGDYTADIIEKPIVEKYGGQIKIVSFVPGRSTTSVIKKIRS